ncbi:MAG: GGDEF domain-containing protein [Campylobacteraceae bacterium]|nr:GGDEF domain-containing protein [Campylobacteraceae bacterium]
MSNRDELTQLYNRHFLKNNILENEELVNKPLLFCISDIDNFKEYNDTYGHQKGDEALQKIAEVKKTTIGTHKNNFIIRLGGEEFGCFIFDIEKAKAYIDDFFQKLSSLKIEHIHNNPFGFCTVSIGAVYCQNKEGVNFSQLYKIADEALYEAKKSGKNRIVYKNISKMDET